MREGGVVREVRDGVAVVALKRTEQCGHCGRCGAFTASGPEEILVEAVNRVQANVGDAVQLEMPAGTVYRAAFMLYGLPLIFGVCGYMFGKLVAGTDGGGLLGALALMVLSYLVIRYWDRRVAGTGELMPVVVNVIGRGEVGDESEVQGSGYEL
ncbi:MAG: SoxR reducing system RseC family protein [Bacillota bacterium]